MEDVGVGVEMSAIYIDMLTIVLAVFSSADRELIRSSIAQLIEDGYGPKVNRVNYMLSVDIYVDSAGDRKILLQCNPYREETSFFRMEFNPQKVSVAEARAYVDQIIPGGYSVLLKRAVVTRCDASVDIHGVDVDDLVVYSPKYRKSSGYYGSGKTETIYIGDAASPKRLCVYDKAIEIRRKNRKLLMKQENIHGPHTRFEFRIREKNSLKNLAGLINPYEKLIVCQHSTLLDNDEKFRLFLDSCRYRGAQDALLGLEESTRKKYKKILSSQKCKWWDPIGLWKGWPEAVADILDPSKAAI